MAKPTLLPDPTCLHLQLLDGSSTTITAVVTTTSEEAECPLCHRRSARIHSRYVREVADLPWMNCAVRLQLHVRRFFCSHSECARRIFTERLPTVVAPYARRTTRLADVFTLIGFALGGEAGSRLVEGMGLSTSPDTLLRLIRSQSEEQAPTPRVLGVDDFSFCKRKTYGTILIDLERRVPIDLAFRSGGCNVQKVVRGPSRCRDHQPRSRWPVCGWSQARSPQRPTGCRSVASVIESFGNDEELLPEQAGPAQRPGAKAIRDDFSRGGQTASALVCRPDKAARRKKCAPPSGTSRTLPQDP
jgi:hypothetical protein